VCWSSTKQTSSSFHWKLLVLAMINCWVDIKKQSLFHSLTHSLYHASRRGHEVLPMSVHPSYMLHLDSIQKLNQVPLTQIIWNLYTRSRILKGRPDSISNIFPFLSYAPCLPKNTCLYFSWKQGHSCFMNTFISLDIMN
jgi:WD40 repeat protein